MDPDLNKVMTLDRLREIVEAYGAAAHRWPAGERQAALTLVADSAAARALLDEALELDRMLDAAPAVAPASDMLVSRIMAARPRAVPSMLPVGKSVSEVRGSGFWKSLLQDIWPYGSPAFPAGALAASIVLGVSIGLSAPSAATALGLATTTATASNTTPELGEQLVVLALAETNYPEEWQQ